MEIEEYKKTVPYHGSYPEDIGYRTVLRLEDEEDSNASEDVILGMVRRRYPEATMKDIADYMNKCYTCVGWTHRTGEAEVVAVYRHDFSWNVIAMSASQVQPRVRSKADLEGMPEC
jgi:hypothetical protein